MIAYKVLEINQLNPGSERYLNQMKSKRKKDVSPKKLKKEIGQLFLKKTGFKCTSYEVPSRK